MSGRVALLQHQAIVVAHVVGEVDMLTGPSLQSHLDHALAIRPKRLIVDLSQVLFLGSTGLAALINTQEAATHQSASRCRGGFVEHVIRGNLDAGRPDRIGLVSGRRLRTKEPRRTPGLFRTRVITERITLSLSIDYKTTAIKQ